MSVLLVLGKKIKSKNFVYKKISQPTNENNEMFGFTTEKIWFSKSNYFLIKIPTSLFCSGKFLNTVICDLVAIALRIHTFFFY